MNRHILDTLNKKETEGYVRSEEIRRQRNIVKKFARSGNLCESLKKENELCS